MALRQIGAAAISSLGLRAQLSHKLAWTSLFSCESGFATVAPGVKYAKSHEWAKPEGDSATVGISDFAQAELGDVVYVELPEVGSHVKKGETFGVVESVKAASDVYSPVSGEVIAINSSLVDTPAQVNQEPFGKGWMIKVKLSNKAELADLLDSAAYEKQTAAAH